MAAPLDLPTFLPTLSLFAGWELDEGLAPALQALARYCEVWSFAEGDLVRFPDEEPAGPTWVAEGCLVVLEAKAPRYVGVRERLEAPVGLWIRGQTAGRFVVAPQGAWFDWLRGFPLAAARLGEAVPPALPKGLARSPLVLEPGERLLHLFHKSPLFLLLRAVLPTAFFLLFAAFGAFLQWGLESAVPSWALWLLPGVGMGVTAGLVGLVAWEWSASVLAVTDRSVLVRQIDVWAHRSDFEKLALDKIREAVFRRSGWIDSLLRLVAVEIEGDSPKGRLVFGGLPHDSRFLAAMEALRTQRATAVPQRKAIRRALADRAGGARSPKCEQAAAAAPRSKQKRLSWRAEKDGGIWFRRHPWFVVRRSLPWAGWTALVLFLGLVAATMAPGLAVWVALCTGAVALVPLARIGWEVWDWADDRLSIQGAKIVLVHKRPLWLGEVRQEGTLDQIQQVGVRKDSLVAMVLDFGVVTISLGAGPPLEFTDAAHPEWVQTEIFHQRTLLAENRERQAAHNRLDEVSEILDTWDEARKAGYFAEPNSNSKDAS